MKQRAALCRPAQERGCGLWGEFPMAIILLDLRALLLVLGYERCVARLLPKLGR